MIKSSQAALEHCAYSNAPTPSLYLPINLISSQRASHVSSQQPKRAVNIGLPQCCRRLTKRSQRPATEQQKRQRRRRQRQWQGQNSSSDRDKTIHVKLVALHAKATSRRMYSLSGALAYHFRILLPFIWREADDGVLLAQNSAPLNSKISSRADHLAVHLLLSCLLLLMLALSS